MSNPPFFCWACHWLGSRDLHETQNHEKVKRACRIRVGGTLWLLLDLGGVVHYSPLHRSIGDKIKAFFGLERAPVAEFGDPPWDEYPTEPTNPFNLKLPVTMGLKDLYP